MRHLRPWLVSFLAVCGLLLVGEHASATGAQRTFVSAQHGDDLNACTPAAPCRTFAHAISLTAYAGEVIAVDSGGYGAFTISGAISITAAPGVYAGISVFSGDGIGVSAGVSDSVVLRGLTINGLGGAFGINFSSGRLLSVEGCTVTGLSNDGLKVNPGADAFVLVNSSVLGRNVGDGINVFQNGGGTTAIDVNQSKLDGNGSRGFETASGRSVVSGSSAIGNGNAGFAVFFDAQLTLEGCVVAHGSSFGILANMSTGAGYVVHVSNCTVTNNGTGLINVDTGTMATRSNNTIENNGADTSGTITTYTAK
jgi:hypothetical protein